MTIIYHLQRSAPSSGESNVDIKIETPESPVQNGYDKVKEKKKKKHKKQKKESSSEVSEGGNM